MYEEMTASTASRSVECNMHTVILRCMPVATLTNLTSHRQCRRVITQPAGVGEEHWEALHRMPPYAETSLQRGAGRSAHAAQHHRTVGLIQVRHHFWNVHT